MYHVTVSHIRTRHIIIIFISLTHVWGAYEWSLPVQFLLNPFDTSRLVPCGVTADAFSVSLTIET